MRRIEGQQTSPPTTASNYGVQPGERMFAWIAYGLTANGDEATPLNGYGTAHDLETAKKDCEAAFKSGLATMGEDAPRLKQRVVVWEIPLDLAEEVLRANGNSVEKMHY